MKIRILLVDDHQIVREGLRNLLDRHEDFQIVGEAGDGREAVKEAKRLQPDVIVMDVAMPGLNGIEATRHIQAASPKTGILALSMHADKHFVYDMIAAKVGGYLLKNCAARELADAVRAVASGQAYFSPEIAKIVMERLWDGDAGRIPADSDLTVREKEVLQLLSEGKTNKEISGILNLSSRTVESHRQNIMRKTGLHSVAELTKYALRKGLTDIDF